MSTIARVTSAIPGEPAHFGTVLAHQPAIAAAFGALYAAFWDSDTVPARIKEVARMRNARVTECGFCRNVRFDKALGQGLVEETVADITDGYETSARLTADEKAALRLTDALIFDPAALDQTTRADLRARFAPGQIGELGLGVSLFLALAKVLITLGLEPETMDRTVLATPSSTRIAA